MERGEGGKINGMQGERRGEWGRMERGEGEKGGIQKKKKNEMYKGCRYSRAADHQ